VLGWIQPVMVEPDLWVVNMIAQAGIGRQGGPPIRYESLRTCLGKTARIALTRGASVHMPRIGSGLAGGNWDVIEEIIQEELVDKGLDVTVYEFDG